MTTITYAGDTNGGTMMVGGEFIEFPAGERCKATLSLAIMAVGDAMPKRHETARANWMEYTAAGDISDADAERIRAVMSAANAAWSASSSPGYATRMAEAMAAARSVISG